MGKIYLYDSGVELDEDGDPKFWYEDSWLENDIYTECDWHRDDAYMEGRGTPNHENRKSRCTNTN